jgi:hypothetical protein
MRFPGWLSGMCEKTDKTDAGSTLCWRLSTHLVEQMGDQQVEGHAQPVGAQI